MLNVHYFLSSVRYIFCLENMMTFAERTERNQQNTSNNENSMHKFVEEFNREIHSSNYPSIDLTVPRLSFSRGPHDWNGVPAAKRSSLTLTNFARKPPTENKDTKPFAKNNEGSANSSNQITLLPMPQQAKKATPTASTSSFASANQKKAIAQSDVGLLKNNRIKPDPQLLSLISGNVEYAIKMHKQYGHFNLLFEIYGSVIRISPGKFACERVVLLRNAAGPILQAVFYEIDMPMEGISVGMNVRCVGKFQGSSRLQLYKISPLAEMPMENSLARLQNLCNFTMNKRKDSN